MVIISVNVLDGRGLVPVVVSDIKDRIRIQDFFREAEILFNKRDGFKDESEDDGNEDA